MAARGIDYTTRRRVYGIDPAGKVAHFKDHDEPFDLFIGIPVHRVPDVVVKAGLTENGWVKVDPLTLATPFPGVYALATVPRPGSPRPASSPSRRPGPSPTRSLPASGAAGLGRTTAPACALWKWATARWAGLTCTSEPTAGRQLQCSDPAPSTPPRRPSSERSGGPGGSTSSTGSTSSSRFCGAPRTRQPC
jgi:hypothetical protein